MISSSEVGGCCRVQVAQLPSDRPLSPHRPQGHVTPLAPAGALPLFRPSIPSALTDPANLQNFRPYHRRSYAYRGGGGGVWELARLFSPSILPLLPPGTYLARAEFPGRRTYSLPPLAPGNFISNRRVAARERVFDLAKNFVGGSEGGTRYARHYLNYQAIRVMRYRVKGDRGGARRNSFKSLAKFKPFGLRWDDF